MYILFVKLHILWILKNKGFLGAYGGKLHKHYENIATSCLIQVQIHEGWLFLEFILIIMNMFGIFIQINNRIQINFYQIGHR